MSRRYDPLWAAALLALWFWFLWGPVSHAPDLERNMVALAQTRAGERGLYMNVRGRVVYVPSREFHRVRQLSHAAGR